MSHEKGRDAPRDFADQSTSPPRDGPPSDPAPGSDDGPVSDGGPAPSAWSASGVLTLGGVLGLAGDRLLGAGLQGPGFAAWIGLLGAAAVLVARRADPPWTATAAGWSGVAVAAAVAQVLVAAPVLHLALWLVLLASASMVLLRAAGVRLGETTVIDHAIGLAMVPARAALGVLPLLGDLELPADSTRRRVAAVGRGTLLAAPLVVVFALLFAAADAGFDRYFVRVATFLSEDVGLHLLLVLAFGWIAAGLLSGVRSGRRPALPDPELPRLGAEETATVLGLLSVLFLLFVALQLGYLFGGRATIETTAGLTPAEYARRGFFELLVVAGLTLAVLLSGDAVSSARRVFRGLGGLLVACVMVILASAVHRLWLYTKAFGLTFDRITAAAVLAWLAVVLPLFAATVLRGRPRRFASGALAAGLAAVFALVLLDPGALAARSNLDRAAEGVQEADVDYLLLLGADAVPVLVDRLDELPEDARCRTAGRLLQRWGEGADGSEVQGLDDWRSWNAARAAARESVAGSGTQLRTLADRCGGRDSSRA